MATKKEQYYVSILYPKKYCVPSMHEAQRKQFEEYLYQSEVLAFFLFFASFFLNPFSAIYNTDTPNILWVLTATILVLVRDYLLEQTVISVKWSEWLNRIIFWIERTFMCGFFYNFLRGQNGLDMKEVALTAAMAGLFVGVNLAYFLSFGVSLDKRPAIIIDALIGGNDTDCESSSSSTEESKTETEGQQFTEE